MRIIEDYRHFVSGGGIEKKLATLIFNPNFHCVCLYRLSNLFYRLHLNVISKIIWYLNRMLFHVDIDYRANLAGGFKLVHGLGTVIGKDVVSEGKLTVYQHVTLGGGNGRPARVDENGKEWPMPLLKDNIIIYTGASVIGGITVGGSTIIKAGRIVSHDIGFEDSM